MVIEIPFTKASGAGNDFVVIDNRTLFLPADAPAIAQRLCSRHFGIGADGLLLIEQSASANFAMRYFNSDGSHGGMCGNGGRCAARYAFTRGIAPTRMTFESLDFVYRAEVVGPTVRLRMKDPTTLRTVDKLSGDGLQLRGFFVDTGSPHVVCFVDDVAGFPVATVGRSIRNAQDFFPEGTNVDFVQILSANSVTIRTYERGVETETLACGTGSVAAGVVSHLKKGLQFPITVRVRSGESLLVNAETNRGQIEKPTIEGSAHMLFSGKVLYDDGTSTIVDGFYKGLETP